MRFSLQFPRNLSDLLSAWRALPVMWLVPAVWLGLSTFGVTQDGSATDSEFDWAAYSSSPADLQIDRTVFRDRTADLDSDQQTAWQNLTDEIVRRRQALREEYPGDSMSRWESAFYRYARVRRTAWKKGTLLIQHQEKLDPFRKANEEAASPEDQVQEYSLIADILAHPQEFVGKPVVFRGILKRPAAVPVGRLETGFQPEGMTLSLGELLPFDGDAGPMAMVHTTSVERTSGDNPGVAAWPRNTAQLPVLVKGWVVKLWGDQRPLIYSDSVRELSLEPPTSLIRQHAVTQRPLLDEESWLYYETLRNLEVMTSFRTNSPRIWRFLFPGADPDAPADSLQQAATRFLRARLNHLLVEIVDKVGTDKVALEQRRDTKKISVEQYEREIKRLLYLFNERRARYREADKDPQQFDTYVDVFMNPDVWQGQLVTLRGHVRHVVSYPARHPEFEGRKLHELWLFTADSQNNPAVIITPQLPPEFPVDAELIDQVTVTGCVFKQYVYRSQESRRIAPLILAGSVQWNPTDSHLRALQDEGHLVRGSALAQRVSAARTDGPGPVALLLFCFVATLTVMILWGRAHRDRRDRRNLMNRIAEKPEFETSLDGDYAPRLSDYTSGYDL